MSKKDPRRYKRLVAVLTIGAAVLSLSSLIRLSSNPDLSGVTERQRRAKLDQSSRTIRLGWTAWQDAEIVSLMAERLIEENFNVPVDMVMADIGIQFESVARGDLDLMLMTWLPVTHRNYWRSVRDRVELLGAIYKGRLGLVVPGYVPVNKVNSISDLAKTEIADAFDNSIQGIDPGSALNEGTELALKEYKIKSMHLVAANLSVMAASLTEAIRQKRWIVVTSLRPHWMFANYDLRFLQDPLGVFGKTENIYAMGRLDFTHDHPQVAAFLRRFEIPDEQFSQLMLQAHTTSPEEAVKTYLQQHPERVRYWITGEFSKP